MSRCKGKKIDWEYGHNGEYIITVDGAFYCTADNWAEVRAAKEEILNQNFLLTK
ncbi:hypothetical protein KQI61_15530 [Anaerocolumna aminovalerica]|uniref:hypothetical protein n=1 Tax=Anaerocolumna aminovalerica TaxID=1527 RepID=UPI001C0F0B25|nr:hypothetical protein [Anaerocolumna aminovalerica]MBU5333610.1 hypothetical protein [Anaerocolumna aminovalerica]